MSEVATRPAKRNGAMVPISVPVAESLLGLIAEAARDQSIDVSKLDVLLRMRREIVADEAKLAFNRAMSAAQAEIQPVVRDTQNTQTNSMYAKLETVDAMIRPIYIRHGFALSYNQTAPLLDGNIRIECRCSHTDGHSETYAREAPPDTLGPKGTPTKTPLHGLGSVDTFLRRYIECGIFNVVLANLDRDGNRQRPPDTGEIISRKQAAELRALMAETRIEEARVIAVKKLGIATIDELPVEKFAAVLGDLISRRKVQQQRTTHIGEAA